MTDQSTVVNLEATQLASLMKVLPVSRDQIEPLMARNDCIDLVAGGRYQGTIGIRKLAPDFLSKLRTAAASGQRNGRHGIYLTDGGRTSFVAYSALEVIART
ncbi:MAG: hypothetical protein IPM23_03595 [Candidatus Melainabacteria bacterium]|nr:hypothetical protein [Candidatus Melainabacteria bacterium]